MYQQQTLGDLTRRKPDEARAIIGEALKACGGGVKSAAQQLKVGERSLWRWIAKLAMNDLVVATKRENGRPPRGGKYPVRKNNQDERSTIAGRKNNRKASATNVASQA